MKTLTISALAFILIIFSCSKAASADDHDDFLQCLSEELSNYSSISNIIYTPNNSSYSSVLRFSIFNLRFVSESTPKPQVIITPEHESQIPPIVYCAKKHSIELRIRSGGHDYEGLSYTSKVPFAIIDLINLSDITVDAEAKTAWVGAGATIGSLYYRIAEKSSTLAFPAGLCPTIGVGGHFSGGGYGALFRKYGLAADNVIDARIVDADSKLLDRRSMGEDLFWAIRGGGGGSFGIVVAWKVQLVDVPEKLTVFTIQRTLEQNATQLIHRWQYVAPQFDRDLIIVVQAGLMDPSQDPTILRNSSQDGRNMTIGASFFSVFLGGVDRLLPLMQESFPELGLTKEDCTEMSWIQSVEYLAGYPVESREVLLNRTQPNKLYMKAKSDYVQSPFSEKVLEGIWRLYSEPEAVEATVSFVPYGGKMAEISESAIPFSHRGDYLYKVFYNVFWQEEEDDSPGKYLSWIRRVYSYMTPYVSKSPRAAYVNYRDLDIGVNSKEGKTSYARASIWGRKYFGNNFDRLVRVKTAVDPNNFFRHEQSIPPLYKKGK